MLLRALEVEKETYEFVYAAKFLPEWMYAAGRRHALADGSPRTVNTDGFLADILAEPEALRAVADAYAGERPGASAGPAARVLLIGMGSSRYAADTAVAALRARGRDAHAELASTGRRSRPRPTRIAVVISASGSVRGDARGASPAQRNQPCRRPHERPGQPACDGGRRGGGCAGGPRGGRHRLPQLRLHPGGAGADAWRAGRRPAPRRRRRLGTDRGARRLAGTVGRAGRGRTRRLGVRPGRADTARRSSRR